MARSGAGNRANYGSRSVTTSASVLVSANPSRQSATIQNVTRRTFLRGHDFERGGWLSGYREFGYQVDDGAVFQVRGLHRRHLRDRGRCQHGRSVPRNLRLMGTVPTTRRFRRLGV